MSKGSKQQPATTVTQQQIPEWLQSTLKPLLQGSTQKLLDFQNQGNAVLQGGNYKDVPLFKDKQAAAQAAADAYRAAHPRVSGGATGRTASTQGGI